MKSLEQFNNCVPEDHSRQVSASICVKPFILVPSLHRMLDFGSGDGSSQKYVQSLRPDLQWIGVDVSMSPEVKGRSHSVNVVTYDGMRLPFAHNSVDLVYSRQVMEHVRNPEEVLAQIYRVLVPDGFFIGSTSHLEAYHSYSYWCFSPWGFYQLLNTAGFEVKEMRPGIDALTLLIRSIAGKRRFFDRYFEHESPLNHIIGVAGKLFGKPTRTINNAKLRYCGHFCFVAQK